MTGPAAHVGLDEIAASLSGAPTSPAFAAHLAVCPSCRDLATRWAPLVREVSPARPPDQLVPLLAALARPAR